MIYPSTLTKILNLQDSQILYAAKTIAHKCMPRHSYLALITGDRGPISSGMAYEVQLAEDSARLIAQENNHYEYTGFIVHHEDGNIALGRATRWSTDQGLLQEGKFLT